MKYRINKTNYRDFNVFEVNRLPARSYFITYPGRETADSVTPAERRYGSPDVICLNGDWDFRFYPFPSEIPDILDTDRTDFDRIDVPSCWQFRGYAKPFYVNARYQFPYRPPEIPAEKKIGRVFTWCGADYGVGPRWRDPGAEYNFAGIYRRFFDIDDTSKRCIISFLGVASSADVYVNGEFCGYTEGSHNTSEFDLSNLVHEGKNELVVVVHRFCNGSYLECQDMFRNTGIFRDVLLRFYNRNDIWDIDFKTEKTASTGSEDGQAAVYRAVVKAELFGDAEVSFTLSGNGICESRKAAAGETAVRDAQITATGLPTAKATAGVCFDGLEIREWTSEDPVLYDLYVEVPGSVVKLRVGFRDVKVSGTEFTLNGRNLKLHGVNHHDTSPENGYCLTPAEIERDVRLCKEYNIDTIRTSHYPPDPFLLEMCDELGIYVVDEADLETHGTFSHMLPPSYNRISNDPKWEAHYVDRAERLYMRDRLHPSIIMWSLGNESGGTYDTDRMYDYIKARSALPVHYESAIHTKRKAYDIASEMYPPVSQVQAIGEKTYKVKELIDRPYFLCEYAHAMGVGPGGMEDYWKEIYAHDNLIGGCVWEMVDHAVLHEDGRYTYGGDHGEWEHDGNFCVDGLFYPDRSPSTGAKIAKYVYRPLRIRYTGGDEFEVFNTKAFTGSRRFSLSFIWDPDIPGDDPADTIVPDVPPLSTGILHISTDAHIRAAEEAGQDCLLTVVTTDNVTGNEAAREQILIHKADLRENEPLIRKINSCSGSEPLIRSEQSDSGALSLLITDGKPVIYSGGMTLAEAGDPYTILFRAPTDNDYLILGIKNSMKPFMDERENVTDVIRENGRTTVSTRIRCAKSTFDCIDVYEETGSGIMVTCMLHCINGKGDLPRFGKAFRLDGSFDKVEYYGRNGESYADMKDHAQIERVSCTVPEMTEPNIRPQESGNRMDTRYASISDGVHKLTFTAVGKPFELGVKPYSDTELLSMKHREDEKKTGTYVTVSAFQKGIGTGICGPKTAPEYCYTVDQDYVLRFLITIE